MGSDGSAARIGVVYPHSEIGTDPDTVASFCVHAEAVGYDHVLLYDHIVGVRPDGPDSWNTPELPFTDFIAFFSFVSAITTRLEFGTNILVLPLRATVPIAKQIAVLDTLSRGRFRLGLGTGWNRAEFAALRAPFEQRGRYLDEQVVLMRLLWSQESVDFVGEFHDLRGVGMSPRPQRPIPVWFGGHVEASLRRVVRTGDGYMPLPASDEARDRSVRRLRELAADSGRDPATIGLEGRIDNGGRSRPPFTAVGAARSDEELMQDIGEWIGLGATHLHLDTRRTGYTDPAQHLEAMDRFRALAVSAGLPSEHTGERR